MGLKNYHLFIGTFERGMMAPDANHYEIKLNTGGDFYRIAVNVRSQDGSMLMTFIDENFQHELCDRLLAAFPENGTYNINDPDSRRQFGLDFLRRNLVVDFNQMVILPNNAPGLDNDLQEKLTALLNKTFGDEGARIFAFGEQWPSTSAKDRYFPEIKDQGLHDIHMNQGNPTGRFDKDNGVYQDGGILFYFPSLNRWAVILLAFQSQFNTLNPATLHTDDVTGHRITSGTGEDPDQPTDVDGDVVIVGALVNPKGNEEGKEKVILMNTTDEPISLDGWQLLDRLRNPFIINNATIGAAGTLEVIIPAASNLALGNKGGTISLLNKQGIKTSGVQYTKQQAQNEGRVIHF
ncbi:DUF2278 family protein [Dyadobacter arcticus]|uniref:Uncharacterized protein YukJ n=1 Tax=Dyadobacter arcticus TaxID=1078754 RepID=A0ABX0UQ45_9BACT|nr:DUF2278 family protein [Dyadobacter arcticus]NIJ54538.1 uncharacterized protein YukJ [Dyadobacter arcticus]